MMIGMNTLGLTLYSAWITSRVSITHKQSQSSEYMEKIYRIRSRIFAANLISWGFGLFQLANFFAEIDLKKGINREFTEKITVVVVMAGILIIGFYPVAVAVNWLGRPFASVLNPNRWYRKYDPDATAERIAEIQENYELKWTNSDYQMATQTLYLCSLVTNCMLALVSKHAVLYSALAILQMSGVIRVARWRFVKLSFVRNVVKTSNPPRPPSYLPPEIQESRRHFAEVQDRIDRMNHLSPELRDRRAEKYRYSYLFSVFQSSVENDNLCTPCQEEGADTYFCSQHRFHFPCILITIIEKLKQIHFDQGTRSIIAHYENGAHVRNTVSYKFELEKDKLPSCPNCRRTSSQNELEIAAYEAGSWISSDVVLK